MDDTIKQRKWFTAKELAKILNLNKRTIERKRKEFIKNNTHMDWFRTDSTPYKYSSNLISEFNPNIKELLNENQNTLNRNKQLSNTIKLLPETFSLNPERTLTLEQYLYLYDWDYFITIAYEESLPQMECFSIMHRLYDQIENANPNKTTRMFFTTEPFTDRKGYHNHFILKSSLGEKDIENIINQTTPKGRIDIRIYDKELAATFYINKHARNNKYWDITNNQRKEEGWDILGNKLKMEALKLANNRVASALEKIKAEYKVQIIKERHLGFKSRTNKSI